MERKSTHILIGWERMEEIYIGSSDYTCRPCKLLSYYLNKNIINIWRFTAQGNLQGVVSAVFITNYKIYVTAENIRNYHIEQSCILSEYIFSECVICSAHIRLLESLGQSLALDPHGIFLYPLMGGGCNHAGLLTCFKCLGCPWLHTPASGRGMGAECRGGWLESGCSAPKEKKAWGLKNTKPMQPQLQELQLQESAG